MNLKRYLKKPDLNRIEALMAVLVLTTGLIHLYIGHVGRLTNLVLAGTGFISGLVIFLTGRYRKLLALTAIPYTSIQIFLYYQTYGFNLTLLAGIDKALQILLIFSAAYYHVRKQEIV